MEDVVVVIVDFVVVFAAAVVDFVVVFAAAAVVDGQSFIFNLTLSVDRYKSRFTISWGKKSNS